MNIQFAPNGNVSMTLRKPTSAVSKLMGFGRPAIISGREEPLTAVWIGYVDSSALTEFTTEASNDTVNDVFGPYYAFPPVFLGEVGNSLYLGFTQPFNAIKIKVGISAGINNSLQWRYSKLLGGWPLVSNLQETVANLTTLRTTTEGIVYWDMPTDWEQVQPRNGNSGEPSLYWIEVSSPLGNENIQPLITRILKTTPP